MFWKSIYIHIYSFLWTQGMYSNTWVSPPALFVLVIFSNTGSQFLLQLVLDQDPYYLRLPHNWDDRHVPPHPVYLLRSGSHEVSPLAGLELRVFLISASQVVGIIGRYHCSYFADIFFLICACLFMLRIVSFATHTFFILTKFNINYLSHGLCLRNIQKVITKSKVI
jgi:hypothetical protein